MKSKRKPSQRSKKADQQTISIAEIKKDPELVLMLRETAEYAHDEFKSGASQDLGKKGWARLVETAKRAKKSPLLYFLQKIEPKL